MNLTELLQATADAIRTKTKSTATINAQNFPTAIENIKGGSGNATAADVLSGKTFSNDDGEATGSMTNNGAVSTTIAQGGSYTIPVGYHNGSGKVSATANSGTASASQVLSGQTFYSNSATKQTGTMINQGTKTYSIATKAQSVTIPQGYHSGSGTVSIDATEQEKITEDNITEGVTILGVTGTRVPKYKIAKKGDIITMDLGTTAAAGTNNTYRVLSIDGTQAKVVAMYDYNTSTKFNSSSVTTTFSNGATGQKYESSNLDTVLNTTFYNAMNDTAKAAIVPQTITQTTTSRTSTTPTSYDLSIIDTSGTTYYYTVNGTVSVGSRYVFALDIPDLAEYKKDFGNYELNQMFYNQNTPTTYTYPWLRSADADYSSNVCCVFSDCSSVDIDYYNYGGAVRPAFVIDLSKVDWS